MIPGSGANGPEEMMPAAITADGKEHSLFAEFAEGLQRSGKVATLALGKPGVEFFSGWNPKTYYYDRNLYMNLTWGQLIENVIDAIELAKTLPCVDSARISLLGHSEGTQVAVDLAHRYPTLVKNLILLGFSGENLATTIDWQVYQRELDSWIIPDVDSNQDGFVSRIEAQVWPEFQWPWQDGQDNISLGDISAAIRADPERKKLYDRLISGKIWEGEVNRTPIYGEAAALVQNLFVFTGALDVQTRPEEALKMGEICAQMGKQNCRVSIVPNVGHGMSEPKGPRKQKFLDMTLGPVAESFKLLMTDLSEQL
jgi:pimeloyl-ACP methyl ester carboxylesterase